MLVLVMLNAVGMMYRVPLVLKEAHGELDDADCV